MTSFIVGNVENVDIDLVSTLEEGESCHSCLWSPLLLFTAVSIFKDVIEVVAFLNFALKLNVDAAPTFLYLPDNFCNPEDMLSSPMISKTLLEIVLLTMMLSFPFPRAA